MKTNNQIPKTESAKKSQGGAGALCNNETDRSHKFFISIKNTFLTLTHAEIEKEIRKEERKMREELSEKQIDKTIKDSFPASDPPSTY